MAPREWRPLPSTCPTRARRAAGPHPVLGHQHRDRAARLPRPAGPRPPHRRADRVARRHVPLPVPVRLQLRRRGRAHGRVAAGTLVFAFHPHQDRLVVAEDDVVALPPGTDPRAATLFPLGRDRTAAQPGRRPGGAGDRRRPRPRGDRPAHRPAAAAGRGHGARRRPAGERRELAASLGIPAVAPEELPARLPPGGVPLLLELSGSPAALAAALDLLAHEGTALVGSWYGRQPVELPLGGAFHRRRLTIRSSQVSTVPAALSAAGTSGAAAAPPSRCSRNCRWPRWRRPSSRSRTPRRRTGRWTAANPVSSHAALRYQ